MAQRGLGSGSLCLNRSLNGALASLSLHGYGVLYLLMCMLHSIVRTVGFLCIIKRHVGHRALSLKVQRIEVFFS